MTGSGIDYIVIPIVATISLAAWLIAVAYAASHPQWGGGRSARRHATAGQAAPADRRPSVVGVQDPAGTAVTGPVRDAGEPDAARAGYATATGRPARQDSRRSPAA